MKILFFIIIILLIYFLLNNINCFILEHFTTKKYKFLNIVIYNEQEEYEREMKKQ
jgi:hypothetical protein